MAKLTLSFKEKKLKSYPLADQEVVIGRAPGCAIEIDSLAVEPEHALIRKKGAHYILTALGENQSIKVNEHSAASHELQDGDVIYVGKHQLSFSFEASATFVGQAEPVTHHPAVGWLQILSGSHLGRTIRLDKAMTRIGKSQVSVAIIVRRETGYFLSHLEGNTTPEVNDQALGEETHALRNGDRIRIGSLQLQFYLTEDEHESNANHGDQVISEQRDFSRVHFEVPATLHEGNQRWETTLLDISLHGALMQRPEGFVPKPDQSYRLDVHLNDDVTIHMDTQVAHSSDSLVGFRCEDIDVDSITHLRRLVELNLGDPGLVERELTALG